VTVAGSNFASSDTRGLFNAQRSGSIASGESVPTGEFEEAIGMKRNREALLVTYDEQTDPELVRTALEDLLRRGGLKWAGLAGDNVQVWRTADLARQLDLKRPQMIQSREPSESVV
jgi:hypothetical protein